MIGSARWSRSYGLTHGSMLQPPTASPAAASSSKRANGEDLGAITLLPQQSPHFGLIIVLVTRLVAAVHEPHRAVASDQHGARHRLHLVELRDLVLGVEQH